MHYKICFYVPESHLEKVKNALFKKGAGKFGDYDCCAWQTKGTGQFRPNAGAKPFIGKVDSIELVDEYKVELICAQDYLNDVINALRENHPYEEPAFQVWPIETA